MRVTPVVVFGLAGLIVLLGALVQGCAGLGMNLIAAPLLATLDPALVPVPLIVSSLLLSGLAMRREWSEVDWRGAGLAVLGRAPGTALGALAVALLPGPAFSVAVGKFVLLCLAASLITWRPRPTPVALLAAGFTGGVTGTASSIGGPPMALLYQHETGPRIRATLAAYMLFGGALSLLSLGIGGQIGVEQLLASAVLLPFLAAGFALSGPLRRVLDAGWTRLAVLGLSGGSAVLLIVRGLM
ncbi:sulfite exporter TauE/SafE family protein [Saccharopolyspora sp. CA-218241]|uniref:sulfite exporter TauE/SafE family protein n=1 Tax=Saccharopolyspora sp. CA-218241 TaxID=3240027 RepID=UPI003D980C59